MSEEFGINSCFRHINDHDDDNAHFFSTYISFVDVISFNLILLYYILFYFL